MSKACDEVAAVEPRAPIFPSREFDRACRGSRFAATASALVYSCPDELGSWSVSFGLGDHEAIGIARVHGALQGSITYLRSETGFDCFVAVNGRGEQVSPSFASGIFEGQSGWYPISSMQRLAEAANCYYLDVDIQSGAVLESTYPQIAAEHERAVRFARRLYMRIVRDNTVFAFLLFCVIGWQFRTDWQAVLIAAAVACVVSLGFVPNAASARSREKKRAIAVMFPPQVREDKWRLKLAPELFDVRDPAMRVSAPGE